MSGIKRDQLDKLFSDYIRERDAWTCARCGTWYQKGSRDLHCSHFIGRMNKAVRYDPDNACAHCVSCHYFLGINPFDFGEWIQNYLGNERYLALRQRARVIPRLREAEKRVIFENLACKLAELTGEAPRLWKAPKPRKKAKRASGKRPRAIRGRGFDKSLKRKLNGTTERRA